MREWPNGGYLYAIVAARVERVKIGIAADPGVRMTTLRGASPVPLYLHSATWHRAPCAAEREAHVDLHAARLHGEWFDMTCEAVALWLDNRPHSLPGEPKGVADL